MALLANLAVVDPSQITLLPRLPPTLVHYLQEHADAGLREGALHLLVDALPKSLELQQAMGHLGGVELILNMVCSVAMGSGALHRSVTPFARSTRLTTAALRVTSGLSAAATQDAVLSLSLLCGGGSEDAPRLREVFGEQGGVAVLLRLVQVPLCYGPLGQGWLWEVVMLGWCEVARVWGLNVHSQCV